MRQCDAGVKPHRDARGAFPQGGVDVSAARDLDGSVARQFCCVRRSDLRMAESGDRRRILHWGTGVEPNPPRMEGHS